MAPMSNLTSTYDPAAPAIPGCPNCAGTGTDPDFGGGCHCAYWVRKHGSVDLRHLTVAPGADALLRSEQVRRQGNGTGSGRSTSTGQGATEAQVRFLLKLIGERYESGVVGDEANSQLARIEAASDHPMSKRAASEYIDMLMAMPRGRKVAQASPPSAKPARTNARPQACERCGVVVPAGEGSLTKPAGRWIVEHVECPVVEATSTVDLRPMKRYTSRGLVRVAVPGGDTRLKLRIKFADDGTVYVDDAAEYGMGRNYGRQVGAAYTGDVADELAAIVADPAAAIIAYTALVGRCGICSRKLEAEESVEHGIGPRCRAKLAL